MNYDEEGLLSEYNAQINPGSALAESWHYDMIESFNAWAVMV